MTSTIRLVSPDHVIDDARALQLAGTLPSLRSEALQPYLPKALASAWPRLLDSLSPGDRGAATSTWLFDGPVERVLVAALPEQISRHNSPAKPHALTRLVAQAPSKGPLGVIVALDSADHALASVCALARIWPTYSRKNGAEDREVVIGLLGPEGPIDDADTLKQLQHAAEGVQLAARLVDTPPDDLHTDAYVDLAMELAASVGAEIEVIRGQALADRGFGGLWGVGRAAEHPPALVVLTHAPAEAERTVCWVGKGITYDTGGLSIKPKTGMPGMKSDMGGSAAVLAAFCAAVRMGFKDRLHAVLCLAENAVGPRSIRPDDVLTLYSGRTVEVNNTDAEGRLVLGDGVAYAAQHLMPDEIVDVATLTGAQMVSTGRLHAGVVCNNDDLEDRAIAAGKRSGDLVHPLPWAPEFFRKEFKSPVADMKNSVKDRMNAQSSCAGLFVYEHLMGAGYEGPWLHVDMAGPSTREERGTGYGVALLLALVGL
ncbi:MAG: M17 family metallopeptidase [Bradymonadia bacterium]